MTPGRTEHASEPPAPERRAPLIAERHRKADGRLLILYRRDPGSEARGARGARPHAGPGA